MNAHTQLQTPSFVVTRPCVRCSHELTDPASVEAGIGPICRGFANLILAKETPSAWSDNDLGAFLFLNAESFPEHARERFEKAHTKICTSKGMNSPEAQKGDDMRATVKELVYLASVAPSNAIYESLIGAIRGVGYVQYAAFVSGQSASGDAALSLESNKVFLKGVRNSVGQEALYQFGARRERSTQRWFISQESGTEFVRLVSIYWPFVKGAKEVLSALFPEEPTTQEVPAPESSQAQEATQAEAPTSLEEASPEPKEYLTIEELYPEKTYLGGVILIVRFGGSEAFADAFLTNVPWYHRCLDLQCNAWRVRSQYRALLEALRHQFFPQ